VIVNINNGTREPIPGVAGEALISIRGDVATVSVAKPALIALPAAGTMIEFLNASWAFVKTAQRTPDGVTFTCRRMADG
jgi:hypothetical protein